MWPSDSIGERFVYLLYELDFEDCIHLGAFDNLEAAKQSIPAPITDPRQRWEERGDVSFIAIWLRQFQIKRMRVHSEQIDTAKGE